jgi:photosystem II stability/assembly factor-like uncharacterized protein
MRILRLLLRIIFVFALCIPGKDICAQWVKIAPKLLNLNQNYLTFISYRYGTLWAGGYQQLFFSNDSGKTWTENSLDKIANNFIYLDFYDKNTIIVSTTFRGIYISYDGGNNWKNIYTLRGCSRVAFYGSSNVIEALDFDGIFHSTFDGGNTWTSVSPGGIKGQDFAIGLDGRVHVFQVLDLPNRMDGSGWIAESNDKGLTWSQRRGFTEADSWTLSADSCDPNRFYLVNENLVHGYNGLSQIFVTTNSGDTWASIITKPQGFFSGSLIQTKHCLYAGIYGLSPLNIAGVMRSTDLGVSWTTFNGPQQQEDSRSMTSVNDNLLFVVDAQGNIWKTENAGGDSLSKFSTSNLLSFSTSDQSTDTIGGFVYVPITINGLEGAEDIEVVMHYDPLLKYDGSFSNGLKLDMKNEQWPGRSKLHITAQQTARF